MNRIIIAFAALAFVQLGSSQTPCLDAQTALASDVACVGATNASTICMGSCRTLYNNIISSCDNTTATSYVVLLDAVCSACAMATGVLRADTICISATDAATVCMGTCRALYDDIINNCDATTSAEYSAAISALCDSNNNEDICLAAQTALASNTACASTTNTSEICTGTCRDLYYEIIDTCDATTAAAYSSAISAHCDDGIDACTTATTTLASNTACVSATTTSEICTGTCRDLYDDIIDNCDATTAAVYSSTINTRCGGGTSAPPDACDMAGDLIDETCLASLASGDNATCNGTCGSQLATAAAACTTTVSCKIDS